MYSTIIIFTQEIKAKLKCTLVSLLTLLNINQRQSFPFFLFFLLLFATTFYLPFVDNSSTTLGCMYVLKCRCQFTEVQRCITQGGYCALWLIVCSQDLFQLMVVISKWLLELVFFKIYKITITKRMMQYKRVSK